MTFPLCRDKKRYSSALDVLAVLRVRQREIDYPLYAFRCQDPQCGGYHLTRSMPPESARLKVPALAPRKEAA